jgi:hypothetical protein
MIWTWLVQRSTVQNGKQNTIAGQQFYREYYNICPCHGPTE